VNLVFEPSVVLTDFEKAAIDAVSTVLPASRLHCCRFHLGQSWLRRIQGLSQDHKVKGAPVAQWLLLFFGLSLLPADEVVAAFTDEIMSRMPNDDRCQRFADYVVEHYLDDGCDFPPCVWAQRPDFLPTPTNRAESFHVHLNAEFLAPHLNIYDFVQALLRQQTATYISTGSLSFTRRQPRADRDKYAKQLQFYTDYRRGILSLKDYLQRSAYRVAPQAFVRTY